jgi:hypothetical protein
MILKLQINISIPEVVISAFELANRAWKISGWRPKAWVVLRKITGVILRLFGCRIMCKKQGYLQFLQHMILYAYISLF